MIDKVKYSTECCNALHYLYGLMRGIELYFDHGYLNSEGIKLLNQAIRIIVEHCPEYSGLARSARKSRDLRDVEKLLVVIHDACYEDSAVST